MQLPRRGFLLWTAGFAAFLPAAAALASLARAVTLRELVRASRRVVVGTALDYQCRWESVGRRKRIVTYTRVRIDESLGPAEADAEILVRTLGGQVAGVGQVVHGEAVLLIGESAILFVGQEPDGAESVVEMAQGHYPIRTAKDGVRRVFPSPRLSDLGSSPDAATTLLIGQRAEDALEIVRKAWRDAR